MSFVCWFYTAACQPRGESILDSHGIYANRKKVHYAAMACMPTEESTLCSHMACMPSVESILCSRMACKPTEESTLCSRMACKPTEESTLCSHGIYAKRRKYFMQA